MTLLSATQIANLAKSAGWKGQDLITAVAVALGESGGRSDAKGDVSLANSTWGPSIGLWQIRSLHSEKGKGTTRDEQANYDPAANAKHAFSLYKASGFQPWSVYNSGAYRQHLPAATTAAGGATGDTSDLDNLDFPDISTGDAIGGFFGSSDSPIGKAFNNILQYAQNIAMDVAKWAKVAEGMTKLFLPTTLVRIFMGLVGTAMVFVGIIFLSKEAFGK